jgi:alkanesulfonate monooxygenase SsuD/methylene tetrahydromethanopterin reductase-like flavin-dependent oxidoreductase (luciferase family)
MVPVSPPSGWSAGGAGRGVIPISLTVPQFSTDPSHMLTLAARAQEYGLKGLFAFDHLVPLGDPLRPVFESTATLGALGATSATTIGSLVLRVTLRTPEVTAAVAATLGAIAPGRAVLGLGIGDSESAEEARRFGQTLPPLEARLALLAETIAAIRSTAPKVPVWVGGRHWQVRAMAARLADGWNAWGADVAELAEEAAEVRELVGERPFTVSWGGTILLAPDEDSLSKRVAERGGSEGVVAGTPPVIKRHLDQIGALADEVVVSVVPNRPHNWDLFATTILRS